MPDSSTPASTTTPHIRKLQIGIRHFLQVGNFDMDLEGRIWDDDWGWKGGKGCSSSHYILAQQHCKTKPLVFPDKID
jgi:hypothetical protein